jgi:hypothetical protein
MKRPYKRQAEKPTFIETYFSGEKMFCVTYLGKSNERERDREKNKQRKKKAREGESTRLFSKPKLDWSLYVLCCFVDLLIVDLHIVDLLIANLHIVDHHIVDLQTVDLYICFHIIMPTH